MIELPTRICTDTDLASSREWLETNGIGGYASSTVSGINTRRYHSLLTAASKPPLGRVRLLSKYEEILRIGDVEYPLSANRFPGSIHPEGFKLLESFALDPFPVWTYKINDSGISVKRSVFAVHGENTVVCRWEVVPGLRTLDEAVELELRPLLACIDYHSLRKETEQFDTSYIATDNCVWMQAAADQPAVYFNHNAEAVRETGDWYLDFEYAIEEERGFDFREDLYQPFSMHFDIYRNPAVTVVSTRQINYSDAEGFETVEKSRRSGLCEIAGADTELEKRLVVAADQFIVARGDGHTVIAGYPWFSDWGRDTMIALPGLTLSTKREGIAQGILKEYASYASEGMIPNRFPDEGETPDYNTVDATLWFFEAARAYAEHTGDFEFVKKELFKQFKKIIKRHIEGTRYGIKVDEDGLLKAGEEGTQLTWMDAKYIDEVFTPRIGKPVEIQALWYNALRTMEDFASRFKANKKGRKYGKLAEKVKNNFNRKFWNADARCLFDVVGEGFEDSSIRPNQIFAVSLHHSMLSASRAKKVVRAVEKELFTPFGLRTLAPSDPAFRPIYIGGPRERDSAYHEGTVWAWLMGAFLDALGRTYPKGRKLNQYREMIFASFLGHTEEAGLGQISEIFDGAEPHHPRGTSAQAWSVAEILRALGDRESDG
ncbi:MAG: glycogen debranching protein [Acidobacteria bacterium]|mgnify:CR=1 FL=1|nr:MAG: glycogen debranching protein [Acidobacteriota bacterium]REJ99124.1 MAG: glycogen debranching protein [Acidobacteriota bacterium]REK16155.1 MAG: glycogen debranching protein [Acidobacteriota bacterium]REK43836.1 MAG: glycogen debranching protein [Acidobacteriota bacterium]